MGTSVWDAPHRKCAAIENDTAATETITSAPVNAAGPHVSSYLALGSLRAILRDRHRYVSSAYAMKEMATGARIAPQTALAS